MAGWKAAGPFWTITIYMFSLGLQGTLKLLAVASAFPWQL